jgi:hypothetical protein
MNVRYCQVRDSRRGLDWWMTTYTNDSELQGNGATSLIFIIHNPPQKPLSFLSAYCVFTCRSLQRHLTEDMFSFTCSDPFSTDSSTELSINWLSSKPPGYNISADTIENAFYLLRASMLWTLPSNGRCSQSHRLATGLCATICSISRMSEQSFVSVFHVYSEIIDNILIWICELATCAMFFFFAWHVLGIWRWRRYAPLKHRLTFNRLHGVISQ